MPTESTTRRSANSDFIRVKKQFFNGLLIAVAALVFLCLILMIVASGANKKVKKYKAVYGPVPEATEEAELTADSTTLPDVSTTDLAGLSGVYSTLPGASDVFTTAPSATLGTAYIVTTNADTLNLRSEASENAGIVGRIPKNTVIYVTTESNSWGYTTYNGVSGWVKMAFLTATASTAPAVTLTPTP